MTDLATPELTADEARELTDEIRNRLDGLLPLIKRAFEQRADRALGYESWQAYCSTELSDVRVPVGERPAMVADLRQLGMSTRAIGAALGVSNATVSRDLSSVTSVTDEPTAVTSLDGRERPATQPPRIGIGLAAAADAAVQGAIAYDKALAEFPELEHYADRPTKAVALAGQLRAFEPAERAARRETLAKVIQAEQEGRLAPKPDLAADAIELADRLFVAANDVTQTAEKVGGADAMSAAVAFADPMQIELWRDQFTELAELCNRIAEACRPKLRRVQ